MRRFLIAGLLLLVAAPGTAQTQRIIETPSPTTATTLQNAATANGNGTVLDASGYHTLVVKVTCTTCSGGTTVSFEGSPDNSVWGAMLAAAQGTLGSAAGSTTATGVFHVPLAGIRYFRTPIASYSAGTVTVTAYASMAQMPQPWTLASQQGTWNITNVSGTVSLPTGASTAANQTTGNTSLATIATNTTDIVSPIVTMGATAIGAGLPNTVALSVQAPDGTYPVADGTVTGRLPAGASPADNESNTNTSLSRIGGFNFIFDGSTWDRWTGAVSQSGTWNIGSVTTLPNVTIGTFPDNEPINVAQMNGVAVSMGNGASGTGVQRVTIANDSTGTVAATQSGTWNIGSLTTFPDNEPFNVAQINGVTPLMGAGNTGTGSPRVTIATDQAALVGFGVYVEDAGETAGANLSMAGSVRRDVPASSAGTTGDNATINSNALGALWVSQVDPCSSEAKTTDPISVTTDTVIIAAAASKKNYICSIVIVAGAAEIVSITEGTGSTCGTSEAALVGSTTDANGLSFAANGGFTASGGNATVIAGKTANVDTCLNVSGSNRVSGFVTWVQR